MWCCSLPEACQSRHSMQPSCGGPQSWQECAGLSASAVLLASGLSSICSEAQSACALQPADQMDGICKSKHALQVNMAACTINAYRSANNMGFIALCLRNSQACWLLVPCVTLVMAPLTCICSTHEQGKLTLVTAKSDVAVLYRHCRVLNAGMQACNN